MRLSQTWIEKREVGGTAPQRWQDAANFWRHDVVGTDRSEDDVATVSEAHKVSPKRLPTAGFQEPEKPATLFKKTRKKLSDVALEVLALLLDKLKARYSFLSRGLRALTRESWASSRSLSFMPSPGDIIYPCHLPTSPLSSFFHRFGISRAFPIFPAPPWSTVSLRSRQTREDRHDNSYQACDGRTVRKVVNLAGASLRAFELGARFHICCTTALEMLEG